tara:strand:- start:5869 stop:6309 length:441 start_codon:yes stop_codon:yes gene_type:complete
MNLVDRFRYVMKVYNETPSSFADKIGVQRSSISHILSERNKPSLDFIQKILEHYPKIDAQWLINGKQSSNEKGAVAEVENPTESIKVGIDSKNTEMQVERKDDLDETVSEEKALEVDKHTSRGSKKVDRIIIFYSDQTFETFNPPN